MAQNKFSIPDNYRNALIALADQGEEQWRAAARLLDALIDDAAAEKIALPKMKAYQDAAALLGVKTVTVRGWVAVHTIVGDALLDEFDSVFRFAHWRAMLPIAKREGKPVEEIARDLAATADDYAGMPIPPDVIAARAASKPKTRREIFEDEINRARAALSIAINHAPHEFIDDVTTLARRIEEFAKKAGMEK